MVQDLESQESATYFPGIFNISSENQAKSIILTPEGGQTTYERWLKETPYLVEMILESVKLDENSLVLDYGCGIGRIAKELIDKTKCSVIGVDISNSMVNHAPSYVNSSNFTAMSPKLFDRLVSSCSLKFDLAVGVWVLQHCFDPSNDVAKIHDSLKEGGQLFVVNNVDRVVPTLERGWVDDSIDIKHVLELANFHELKTGELDPKIVPKCLHDGAFWGLYGVCP